MEEELDQQAAEDAEKRLNSVAGAFGFGSDEDTAEDDETQQQPQKTQKTANTEEEPEEDAE